MDTQGSLTHIAMIFKFGDVSGPRASNWPRARCLVRGLGLKDRIRMKGQGGGVGAWMKGDQAGAWARGALVLRPKVN